MAGPIAFLRERFAHNPDLRTRTVSGLLIAALAVVPVLLGGPLLALVVALAGVAMAWEYRHLHAGADPGSERQIAYYTSIPAAATALAATVSPAAGVVFLLLAAALHGWLDRRAGRPWRWSTPGLVVIGLACIAFVALRAMVPEGLTSIVWLIMVVVATDVGAYAFGRRFGGPKLWPRISPNKTWAGLAGGVLCAAVSGTLFAVLAAGSPVVSTFAASAFIAVVAQGGDLVESAVKRRFGAKDASTLIPGHGGVLDRLDGFVAATLVVAAATWLDGRPELGT